MLSAELVFVAEEVVLEDVAVRCEGFDAKGANELAKVREGKQRQSKWDMRVCAIG